MARGRASANVSKVRVFIFVTFLGIGFFEAEDLPNIRLYIQRAKQAKARTKTVVKTLASDKSASARIDRPKILPTTSRSGSNKNCFREGCTVSSNIQSRFELCQ